MLQSLVSSLTVVDSATESMPNSLRERTQSILGTGAAYAARTAMILLESILQPSFLAFARS